MTDSDLLDTLEDIATTDIDAIFGAHVRYLVKLKKLREEIDRVLEHPRETPFRHLVKLKKLREEIDKVLEYPRETP